jgi:hypothetical protein
MLKKFPKQFADALLRRFQSAVAGGRGFVQAADPPFMQPPLGAQKPFRLEAAKQRIHGAGAQVITMARQLLNHAETENRPLAGMEENVQANEAGIEIMVVGRRSSAHATRLGHGASPNQAVIIEIR